MSFGKQIADAASDLLGGDHYTAFPTDMAMVALTIFYEALHELVDFEDARNLEREIEAEIRANG